eukprot:m.176990 g.176990  ORF g.176990 m.176990 type:complete len:713 (+) comp10435_c5_seq1:287-2425(+)
MAAPPSTNILTEEAPQSPLPSLPRVPSLRSLRRHSRNSLDSLSGAEAAGAHRPSKDDDDDTATPNRPSPVATIDNGQAPSGAWAGAAASQSQWTGRIISNDARTASAPHLRVPDARSRQDPGLIDPSTIITKSAHHAKRTFATRRSTSVHGELMASNKRTAHSTDEISLNVGGTIFHCSRAQLTAIKGSVLDGILCPSYDPQRDDNGNIAIQRDPAVFRRVLAWLAAGDGQPRLDMQSNDQELERELVLLGLSRPPSMRRMITVGGRSSLDMRVESVDGCEVLDNNLADHISPLAALAAAAAAAAAANLAAADAATAIADATQAVHDLDFVISDGFTSSDTTGGPPSSIGHSAVAAPRSVSAAVAATVASTAVQDPSWLPMTPMHCPRSDFASCHVDGRVFVCGGWDGGATLDSCEVYLAALDTWLPCAPLNESREDARAAVHQESVFIVGGADADGNILDSIERYDIASDTWELFAQLPFPRAGFALGIIDSCLIVAGGCIGNVNTTRVDILNLNTGIWHHAAPMHEARAGAAYGVINKKFYVAGGDTCNEQSLVTMEVFDSVTETWVPGPSMLHPRSDCASAVYLGRLYVAGGGSWRKSVSRAAAQLSSSPTPSSSSPLSSSPTSPPATTVDSAPSIPDARSTNEAPRVPGLRGDAASTQRADIEDDDDDDEDDEDEYFDSIDCYDPALQQWFCVGRLSTPRLGFCCAIY